MGPLISAKKPTAKGFPVHPRVDINWTQGIVNYNMTKEERDTIMSHNLVLTKLVVLNRHGHRAPNAPYWDMCKPDRKNLRHYKDVNPEDLTAMGMQEEYDFGLYLRHKYKDFLGDRFNRTMHYFRAVGEPRILQSAMAVAQALFPDGFGPGGYLPSRPQFVPIFSDMDTHEYLLDDVPCFRRAERDSHWWIENKFDQFVKDPEVADVLNYLQAVCKAKHTDYKPFAFIKTVADGMTFNHDLGLQLAKGKVTEDWLYRIRNVSLQLLMQRLYTSDEQQTYTVVDLPNTLLTLLNHTHVGMGPQTMDFRDTRQEATLFFVHREALYAFAQFFGIQYRVAGLPPGEVPVASSVIIEKFMPEKNQFSHDETKVYIRMSLWTPRTGASVIPVVACRIPELCEFSELRRIYTTRIQRTGTWEKLCNYTPQEIDHTTDIR